MTKSVSQREYSSEDSLHIWRTMKLVVDDVNQTENT